MEEKDPINEQHDEIEPENEDMEENYVVLGMCFGTCAGSVVMSLLMAFGHTTWSSLAIGVGSSLGMIIGMMIKKK